MQEGGLSYGSEKGQNSFKYVLEIYTRNMDSIYVL